MKRFRRFLAPALALAIVSPAVAQEATSTKRASATEVPRVRTIPGIESPAFPYAEPEAVGLSSEKLER
ncbi:MAG: hypothetical protein R3326_07675, partial [Gemmatimonadota bacterium]|nr:hypothetical protein [Gemmatimonadota bacterium]